MINIKFILQSKSLSSELHVVALRVIFNRKKREFGLNWRCKTDEFENEQFTRKHKDYRRRNALLTKIKSRAYEIIDTYKLREQEFTFEAFRDQLFNIDKPALKDISVFEFFNIKIDELNLAGRTGNAKAFRETKVSLSRFFNLKELKFADIDFNLLIKYETFLRSSNNSDSGVAFRMRELRSLYNDAIKRGYAKKENYPFTDFKVSKYKLNPVRKALNKEEITSFIRIDISKYPHLINSYHYFLFSFYTRGMNFYDMMKLTWDNVREDNIFYIRSKTKGNFTIKILEPVRNILDYYKVKGKTKYIFPILLRENLTPLQVENRKNKTLQKYNKDLKELARIAGIEKSISSYSVRHSYGTYLKFMGVSTDIISESMGHSNLNVTQAYLKSFDDEILDNANEVLLSLDD